MTALLAHATAALAENTKATASYVFDAAALKPDPQLLAHAKEALLAQPLGEAEDAKYFDLLRKGEGRYTAARQLGLNPVLIKRRIQADEDFAERVSVAEAEALEKVVKEMRSAAELGDVKAATWLLERKNNNEFGMPDKKTRHDIHIHLEDADPLNNSIRELEAELIEAQRTKQLGAGIIDIPESETEEL